MAAINALSRELVFKLVYYGPGLSGKTTSLQYLYATAKPEYRGKMVSLATPVDRTLYFDYLPIRVPRVRGMNIRLQLFTVPGQVYYNATRKLVLTGADGVVFVSDSQPDRMDANLETLENLRENLREYGRDLESFPHILQHNKRDLPDPVPLAELDRQLNPHRVPSFGTVATSGEGIYEALQAITEQVVEHFERSVPSAEQGVMAELEAVEGGLADALRNARPSSAPPVRAVVHGLPTLSQAPSSSDREHAAPLGAGIDRGVEAPGEVAARAALGVEPREGGFSLAGLWPEAERPAVREAEMCILNHRYARAIELCDGIVARVLANTAMLFGAADAPREPSVVSLLLGIDGRRYLWFRSMVRNARAGFPIDGREALSALTFAAELRAVRQAL